MRREGGRSVKKQSGKARGMLLFAAVCITALFTGVSAYGSGLTAGRDSYQVSFTADKKMVSDFKSSDMYNEMSGMQPGDSVDIVMNLKNEYPGSVDWYMTNKVLKSLEDTRVSHEGLAGGAYTYRLKYRNSATGAEKTLFDSDTVGGQNVSASGEGLHEATGALKDWLFLDTFDNGGGGVLTLTVELDGETQGNDYQDTLAELQMNFAVELRPSTPDNGNPGRPDNPVNPNNPGNPGGSPPSRSNSQRTQIVQTGDYSQTLLYIAAAGISGIILLVLALYSLRERRRRKKDHS